MGLYSTNSCCTARETTGRAKRPPPGGQTKLCKGQSTLWALPVAPVVPVNWETEHSKAEYHTVADKGCVIRPKVSSTGQVQVALSFLPYQHSVAALHSLCTVAGSKSHLEMMQRLQRMCKVYVNTAIFYSTTWEPSGHATFGGHGRVYWKENCIHLTKG